MQVEINSRDFDPAQVHQILKFYLGRLNDQILKLHISLERLQNEQFSVTLMVTSKYGDKIEFHDIETDMQSATQRILNRLVRHLQRQKQRQQYLGAI